MTVQWGSVAEWVGGTATAAALVFTGWQLRRDRRATEHSSRLTEQALAQTERALEMQATRDQRDLAERERSQAALISCEATLSEDSSDGNIAFRVLNRSALPIFDVRGFVCTSSGSVQTEPHTIAPAPPLPPTSHSGLGDGSISFALQVAVNRVPPPGQYAGITFRDNASLLWIKWGDGHLKRGTSLDLGQLSPVDRVLGPEDDPRLNEAD